MAEINYTTEKCWSIKEKLPIKAKLQKIGGGYNVVIPPMTMTYETFEDIHMSITHMETFGIRYDYTNGKLNLNVTEQGLKELRAMTDIIVIE